MLRHPARWMALGFGSGLSPKGPGTVGTLWAWAAYLVLHPWLGDGGWGLLVAASWLVGVWACTRTAQHLGRADPPAIVWDEIAAFWTVLWLLEPQAWGWQLLAFAAFRYFDIAKPGVVRWADQRFKLRPGEPIGWRQGVGILWDDAVAAALTLFVVALVAWSVRAWTS